MDAGAAHCPAPGIPYLSGQEWSSSNRLESPADYAGVATQGWLLDGVSAQGLAVYREATTSGRGAGGQPQDCPFTDRAKPRALRATAPRGRGDHTDAARGSPRGGSGFQIRRPAAQAPDPLQQFPQRSPQNLFTSLSTGGEGFLTGTAGGLPTRGRTGLPPRTSARGPHFADPQIVHRGTGSSWYGKALQKARHFAEN